MSEASPPVAKSKRKNNWDLLKDWLPVIQAREDAIRDGLVRRTLESQKQFLTEWFAKHRPEVIVPSYNNMQQAYRDLGAMSPLPLIIHVPVMRSLVDTWHPIIQAWDAALKDGLVRRTAASRT